MDLYLNYSADERFSAYQKFVTKLKKDRRRSTFFLLLPTAFFLFFGFIEKLKGSERAASNFQVGIILLFFSGITIYMGRRQIKDELIILKNYLKPTDKSNNQLTLRITDECIHFATEMLKMEILWSSCRTYSIFENLIFLDVFHLSPCTVFIDHSKLSPSEQQDLFSFLKKNVYFKK